MGETEGKCTCGRGLEFSAVIDGPNHPGDYQLDWLDLYQCPSCGELQLRREWCVHFDFTGCNDEYAVTYSVIDVPGLVRLLLKLEQDLKLRPAQSFAYGRRFPGALAWAQAYGDSEIIRLLKAGLGNV